MSKEKIKGFFGKAKIIATGGVPALAMQFQAMVAHANGDSGNSGSEFDWIKEGDGNGAFSDLTNTVKETGQSAYQLMLVIGVVGLVLAIMAAGLCVAFGKNANKRSENIGWILWIAIGGIIFFGGLTILSILKQIGGSL